MLSAMSPRRRLRHGEAGEVRRDQRILHPPQRVLVRQRLGVEGSSGALWKATATINDAPRR
jgi:hypothetical protein